MDDSQVLKLTDTEIIAFFDELFPCGFAGADVLGEITPEGWQSSPLFFCFHPSPEQVFKEQLQMYRRIEEIHRDLKRKPEQIQSMLGPEPTLEDILTRWKEHSTNVNDEATELVGLCLWDIFSQNNKVTTKDDRWAYIGSFRGAASFLDDYLKRDFKSITCREGDHMRFYMGTIWINDRADLGVVYNMIFKRLKLLGADWEYIFPEMNLIDLSSFKKVPESSIDYSPSASWMAQQEYEENQAELEKMRVEFSEINAQSRREAMDRLIPSVVRGYQYVYGRNPIGWPPV